MGYYEFKITASAALQEALIAKTARMGALGSVLEEDLIIVYFPDVLTIRTIVDELLSFREVLRRVGLTGDLAYEYVFISERDWNESWKKKFQPLDVGETLSVIPPWKTARPGRVNLIIDPGMAFGTGHHETTMRCLALIERLARRAGPKADAYAPPSDAHGTRFLDIGTGTGILAIAASKLGFTEVTGLDIDPYAVEAALRNTDHNGLKNVQIMRGTASDAVGTYDCIAANLLSEILISLSGEIGRRLNRGGILIASGIIEGQEGDVVSAMEQEGVSLLEKHVAGRWVSLVFRR